MKAPDKIYVEVCDDGIFAFPEPPFYESVEYIRADLAEQSLQQEQTECIYGRSLKEREKYCKFCSAVCKVRVEQEQPKDKQIVIITESHGDANIEWDCRSLDDVIALLNCAESFITEKQIEKIAGPGSGPDYATTEGRYSYLFKRQQEQPEVDLEKFDKDVTKIWGICAAEPNDSIACLHIETFNEVARHFYELGLNARKEG